ncbi:MAG: serine/threonine-protein kinase [Actinomycetota bacterium]
MTGGPAGDGATTEVGHLGPYRLLHRLGEGGMGVVHLGLDRAGRAVAIKVLRAHVAHDPDARARLRREVSSLLRVRHPLVAEVLDADVDGDLPYVVTRFVPGPGLDTVVKDEGALSAARLTVLGRGLSQALGAIHAAGVVHRDLKPGNVLVLDGQPVVIDFGIAHVADDVRLTSVGLVMGTPGYLSPEVIDGEPVGTATDWWGWAATLAFAASGRPPFGRGPMDVVIDRVRRGQCDLDGVDRRLQPLLVAALDVDPARRPGADEVLHALDRYAAGEDTTLALSSSAPAPTTRVVPLARTAPVTRPTAAGAPMTRHLPEPALPLLPFGVEPPVDPSPRPTGRARRNGTLAAVLAALVGSAVTWPTATAAVAGLLMVLARTVDRSGAAMTRRRYDRGGRRTDVLVGVVSVPWHLVGAVVATLLASVLPVVLGAATAFSAGLLITGAGASPRPTSPPALAAGAAVALLTAWWGPGGSALRRGSRVVVRATVPSSAAAVLVVLLLVVAAGAVVAGVRIGHPVWWPISSLPFGLTLP